MSQSWVLIPVRSSFLLQLQQMLQTFQQQPGKLQTHAQPPANLHHSQAQAQTHPHLQPQNLTPGLGTVAPHLALPTQPIQQKTAFDKVAVSTSYSVGACNQRRPLFGSGARRVYHRRVTKTTRCSMQGSNNNTLTFSNLADALIQSDLQ